jgi:hypothetical protein
MEKLLAGMPHAMSGNLINDKNSKQFRSNFE